MKRKKAEQHGAQGTRYADLKKMLEDRRREIVSEVQGKIRDVRAEGSSEDNDVLDQGESSEADIQEDIEFALIQMKSETLSKINEALARLEEGTYGNCFECGDEIAEPRLRALPFAVRCKDCEEARETPSSASGCWRSGAARRRCSSTCRARSDASRPDPQAPPVGGACRRSPPCRLHRIPDLHRVTSDRRIAP